MEIGMNIRAAVYVNSSVILGRWMFLITRSSYMMLRACLELTGLLARAAYYDRWFPTISVGNLLAAAFSGSGGKTTS